MNYVEAMDYIKDTAKFGSNYGLSRTEKILEFLGDPHKKLKCIHIAGTNGKGSTTAMLNEILKEAGYKVGMYTSPYLEEFEERIQINGRNILKEDLSSVITEVSEAVQKVIALGFEHPTEFEIITCAMFLYFYNEKVDYAVIEVGLGGRLDSTNVIKPILTIITSISFDHMKILGDTLGKIAFEKAGIIKEGVPLLLYPQEAESFEVINKICKERNSRLIEVPKCSVSLKKINKEVNSGVQGIIVKTSSNIYNIELSLLGKPQLLNCSVVIFAVEELIKQNIIIKKEHILEALKKVKWPGRLEILSKIPLVVIDGAHNIDGIMKLKESIETYFSYKDIVLILGILADKQVDSMLKVITPMAAKIIAVTPHSDRAELACDLAESIAEINPVVEYVEDYREAYKKALTYCSKDTLLLISGSLYMIGDMRKIIKNS
ncbi:bifunctional folylpolyglutamate synthase/dihydrofolate synthase [Candidatus Clostridium stratigraminis]|uniref:tetrahydrofolate synthase n=1 Tax=Candidatus Clostridium stratigraminis TaxID=3381661 RepID=A0ABW8T648_9CLOT